MSAFLLLAATYAGLGAVTGLLAGLLGVGGGMVMVPALYWIFSAQGLADSAMHIAVATSMAVIIPTGFVSARSHYKRGGVDWALWRRWVPGAVAGVIIGTLMASHMPKDVLRIFFGTLLLGLAGLMLWTPHTGPKRQLPETLPVMLPLGALIGFISALAGIGGATLSVPAMRFMNRPLPRAIGTASALGVVIAIPACAMYLVLAPYGHVSAPWVTGSVHLKAALLIACTSLPMAPVGAKLTHTLPVRTVKAVFVVFMVLVSAKLLLEGVF